MTYLGSDVRLDGLRVLVIDDNDDAAESVAWLLADLGAVTRVSKDALHVVALVDEFNPRLVLLDIALPKVDGYDACRLIRGAFGDGVFIAALTGWSGAEHEGRCREAGFDIHLVKPAGFESLVEVAMLAQRKGL